MKILALGDVVGARTIAYLSQHLWKKRSELGADLVIANGENVSDIHGIGAADAEALFDTGIDLLTTGNHVWGRRDIYSFLDENPNIIRPANYHSSAPGNGYVIRNVDGWRVLCLNLAGTVYLDPVDNPFETADRILSREFDNYDFAVIDFHAEATSEKIALGKYLDGRAALVFGTHTHVTTADEKILPHGTAYITDLGMSGPVDGVLGASADAVIGRFITHMPARFSVAEGDIEVNGILVDIDTDTFRARSIKRIKF